MVYKITWDHMGTINSLWSSALQSSRQQIALSDRNLSHVCTERREEGTYVDRQQGEKERVDCRLDLSSSTREEGERFVILIPLLSVPFASAFSPLIVRRPATQTLCFVLCCVYVSGQEGAERSTRVINGALSYGFLHWTTLLSHSPLVLWERDPPKHTESARIGLH